MNVVFDIIIIICPSKPAKKIKQCFKAENKHGMQGCPRIRVAANEKTHSTNAIRKYSFVYYRTFISFFSQIGLDLTCNPAA